MAITTSFSPPPISPSPPSCSVCLESVGDDPLDRSIAKLKCGHTFHLDCIGSAFNAKGRMQCPNCRHVEQGQWLYANGCYLHEDLVDDFTIEEDIGTYGGTATLQFMPTPWCPHQGSYAHFSFTLGEFDNLRIGFAADMNPVGNVRHGSRAHSTGNHICPYIAVQGLSVGQTSPHFEDFRLHVSHNYNAGRNTRRAGNSHSTQRNTPTSGTSSSMMYEGSLLSIHQGQQPTLGFVVGGSRYSHSGMNQVGNTTFGQPVHLHHNLYPQNSYNRSQQNVNHALVTDGGWSAIETMNEYVPVVSSASAGQPSTQVPTGIGIGWTATSVDSQIDPWTMRAYGSQHTTGPSNNWWPWVSSGNNLSQRLVASAAPNAYHHDDPFSGARLFPAPRTPPVAGLSGQRWVSSGYQ